MNETHDDVLLRRLFATVRESDALRIPPFEPMLQAADRAARIATPRPKRPWFAFAAFATVGASALAVIAIVLGMPTLIQRSPDRTTTRSPPVENASRDDVATQEPLAFLLHAPGVFVADDSYSQALDVPSISSSKGNLP